MTKKIEENTFVSHLTELRSRLVKSLIFIFIVFVIAYIFAENIYVFLVEPYAQAVKNDGVNRRVIFPELHYGRDALVAVGLFLTHLVKSKKTCSDLRKKYNNYFMSKKKIQLLTSVFWNFNKGFN